MDKRAPQQDDVVVEKVVLSFGINGRQNKSDTTVNSVQGAIRSTKRRFPYAQVWVPLINFSSALPNDEKENLQSLNAHIKKNMGFIPPLPEEKFVTTVDDVHWTSETGAAMFDHWTAFLNLSAP
ncbi:hypothetical protein D5F01_LYC20135 [Xyrichtys novacula]|uniref:Uncharacterized protein n=1 Tax=Xyrichtys novacula TaxID=13765 RepID=A0AAV1GUQ4_XYRNO|nr:hypothetical protein D5F01_LYC20135 [Xyrichtys novacula]